jgi:hypothetical protein
VAVPICISVFKVIVFDVSAISGVYVVMLPQALLLFCTKGCFWRRQEEKSGAWALLLVAGYGFYDPWSARSQVEPLTIVVNVDDFCPSLD